MKPTNERISPQTAQELLALASHIETQKHHEYIPTELMQAAAEAGISLDSLQEALRQLQVRQNQQQTRHYQFRLILGSGLAGAAITLLGLGAYSKLSHQPIPTSADTNALTTATQFPLASRGLSSLTPNTPTSDGYAATYTGTVQQYLLNPEGRVNGLLLKNGLQIKVPPHLSEALTNLVNPGSEISITGTPGMPTRFGQEIRAIQIVNRQTQQPLSVQPPVAPPLPPSSLTNYTNLSVTGSIQHWLVGHRGELNGAVLASGVQVRFPPPVGDQLLSLIQGNDNIRVQGFGIRTPYGEAIEATTLTINGQSVAITPPPKKPGCIAKTIC